MIDVLATIASALLSVSFGWSLYRFAGVGTLFAGGAAATVFLAMSQLRANIARARECRTLEENLNTLRADNVSANAALEETKKHLADVSTALAQRLDSQEKKLTGELKAIERLIREFAARAAAKAAVAQSYAGESIANRGQTHAAAQVPAEPPMLELIRRALEENRVDLYLQPVVSLPQRKVRFYEALSRLRSEDGAVIMPDQYIKVAAPAGLMSVVDNLLLFRCVQVVRRLTQRSRNIAVFCNISGHTLNDAQFFPQFLDFMHHHRDLASQIVFEFPEDAVLSAGAAQEANLKYLAGLGFRLSMDQVSTLDLDFAKLKRLGFEFVKVRAATLIHGMRNANAQVAAEDLKDLLARNGINLIAERIEDERAVVQLLEFNVGFGQGYLFGEPRPVREVDEVYDPRSRQPDSASVTALKPVLARRLAG